MHLSITAWLYGLIDVLFINHSSALLGIIYFRVFLDVREYSAHYL